MWKGDLGIFWKSLNNYTIEKNIIFLSNTKKLRVKIKSRVVVNNFAQRSRKRSFAFFPSLSTSHSRHTNRLYSFFTSTRSFLRSLSAIKEMMYLASPVALVQVDFNTTHTWHLVFHKSSKLHMLRIKPLILNYSTRLICRCVKFIYFSYKSRKRYAPYRHLSLPI